jgi:uncharacterized DUF497 family protein
MFGRWLKEFEWDENKCKYNIVKHGIDFEIAKLVFKDLKRLEYVDGRFGYGETRLQTIGCVKDRIVFVVYTLRGKTYRLISARFANKKERNKYAKNFC